MVDVLTGFICLYALRSKTEREVAKRLWQCMCLMGVWKIGQSDNGGEFDNKVLHELSVMLGVERRFISAYHPRADGLVENAVKQGQEHAVKDAFRCCRPVEVFLACSQMFLNGRHLERIGMTPFEAMFGRPAVRFADYQKVLQAQDPVQALRAWLSTRRFATSVIWPAIAQRTHDARAAVKAKFRCYAQVG